MIPFHFLGYILIILPITDILIREQEGIDSTLKHCLMRILEKEMATHSCVLAWKSHGYRKLMGYSPWGHKELDPT